mgnify:CR=1 FL=1
MEDSSPAWYGNYDVARWQRFRKACEDFINKMNANPEVYHLVKPAGNKFEDYRYAFRSSYLLQGSPEVIMSVRVHKNAKGNDYGWVNLRTNARYSYCPTQEYVEMFPWADGTPFDWDETEAAGKLDQMFVTGDVVPGKQMLQNRVYTRDQLLDEVWGFEYYGDSRTVDVHIKRLREKLAGASDKWELKTVWGVGYKFEVRQ